jgi:hypothetical protein
MVHSRGGLYSMGHSRGGLYSMGHSRGGLYSMGHSRGGLYSINRFWCTDVVFMYRATAEVVFMYRATAEVVFMYRATAEVVFMYRATADVIFIHRFRYIKATFMSILIVVAITECTVFQFLRMRHCNPSIECQVSNKVSICNASPHTTTLHSVLG